MIGDPLVEQVLFALIVGASGELVVVRVLVIVQNPLDEFGQQGRGGFQRINALSESEVISFCKDGESVETVLG